MKKSAIATLLSVMLIITVSAQNKTDSDLQKRVAELEKKVAELEKIVEPIKQQEMAMKQLQALRQKAFERARLDLKKYPKEKIQAIEKEYQEISRKLGTPEGKKMLAEFIKTYPDINRTGCALLYLANISTGEEADKLYQEAIAKGDCWYFDGVQVGAYARFLLGINLWKAGKKKEAEVLFNEIRKNYPDAISHRGKLLTSMIPKE